VVCPIPEPVAVNVRIVGEDQRRTSGIESNYIIVITKDFVKEFTNSLDEVYAGTAWSSGVKEDWTAIICVRARHIGRDLDKGYRGFFSFKLGIV
jgi:hypothetical protein